MQRNSYRYAEHIVLFISVLFFALTIIVAQNATPDVAKKESEVWHTFLEEAVSIAKKENKDE